MSHDYYCAEYDSQGDIRLNCGAGLLVARADNDRREILGWFKCSPEGRFREQYRAALALLDGRHCPDRATS